MFAASFYPVRAIQNSRWKRNESPPKIYCDVETFFPFSLKRENVVIRESGLRAYGNFLSSEIPEFPQAAFWRRGFFRNTQMPLFCLKRTLGNSVLARVSIKKS